MKKLFVHLIFCLLSLTACLAQPANINISNTLLFEGEPYIAVNPTNHQNIVIAWMAADLSTNYRVSIKSKTSFDGGATWGNQFIQPHMGGTWHSADVSMQFHSDGTLYLAYVDYHEAPDSGGVYITHSVNGGVAWTTPSQVWNGVTEDPTKRPLDRPWLAVDNSGTANDGMLYLTTKPAPWIPAPNRPYLKSSSDGGVTWSAYRYVDTTNYLVGNLIQAPMGALTSTSDGALCIAYPSYLPSQSIYPKIFLAKSYNHGASFQYYSIVVNPKGVADTLYKLGYRLAANPANPNQLAFASVGNYNGDPDIFVSTSNNGGSSWSAPLRVNDDGVGNGKAQDMVWADYDNNKLVVTWRDRRNGSDTGFFQPSDTYCAVSTDNGISFRPNMRLSNVTAAFDSILMQNGNDFLGCKLLNDTIYAAWGDVRTGNLNIFFARTSDWTGTGTSVITVDKSKPEISVYPNPTSDKLLINFNSSSLYQIELKIISLSGGEILNTVIENNSSQNSIDISRLKTGIYFINALVGNQTISRQKIVIEK